MTTNYKTQVAIVGSGPNSCILHYSASARRMKDGEVLLIDFGPEVDHYTTDITRTWPVGGSCSMQDVQVDPSSRPTTTPPTCSRSDS